MTSILNRYMASQNAFIEVYKCVERQRAVVVELEELGTVDPLITSRELLEASEAELRMARQRMNEEWELLKSAGDS